MAYGRYTPEELRFEIENNCWPAPSGCREWIGATNGCGYGLISLGDSRKAYTHRAMYELSKGPIPEGHQIDHLCRNRICCNPEHLEAVTPQENARRSNIHSKATQAKKAAMRTHCGRGHEINPANMYVSPTTGRRQCRPCRRLTNKSLRQRRKVRDGRNPVPITYRGEPATLQELADKFGIDRYTLRARILRSKWPEERWHLPPTGRQGPRQSS